METIFIYFIKSSALIAAFYLAYHFLLRKETFFDNNRWFLLSGLFTSLLLPLYFIKKVVYIEKPRIKIDDLIAYSQQNATDNVAKKAVEAFDWVQFVWISYSVITLILVLKIVFSFVSLYRMLYKQQVIVKERFKLVNLNQNIAPFSFFNYIVINSSLYSNDELQSILLHEQIHSKEKHSFDVLIAKMFCVIFWFNPFIWLYKKSITQNLEYIADQKAMKQIEDKTSYQLALLKVVSNQNCLSITNNFYQSLIKKRIVMLNKNQSHKKNSLKYALIIPVLLGFVLLFQIKTIAQERMTTSQSIRNQDEIKFNISKNTTDEELKRESKRLKERGVTLKYSKVKRNTKGEITSIKLEYKDNDGNKGTSHVESDEPISTITFYKKDNKIGFGKPKGVTIINNDESIIVNVDEENTDENDSYSYTYSTDHEYPIPPVAPIAPIAPTINMDFTAFPNMPIAPTAPSGTPMTNEKDWAKFEKAMADFEKKMEALEPEFEAYAEKMANVDELMKPFEEEMKKFELQMQKFEEEMAEYAEKIQARAEADREKVKDQKARNKR